MRDTLRRLEHGDALGALQRLLDLWPTHRDPGVAEQIDLLGRHLARSVKKIPKQRRHTHWVDRFADRQPADLTVMLDVIQEGTSRELKARFDALLELPPDPRTTKPLAAWAALLQSTSFGPWGKVWTALFKVALHVGDPRMAYELKRIRDAAAVLDEGAEYPVYAKLIERIDKTLEKFPASSPPVDTSALAAAVERICAGPPPGPSKVYSTASGLSDEIRDQIYENPDDDGPIQVWADLLQQDGDPLGTLVTLQLQAETRALKNTERTEERKLLKAHQNTLLGPLAAVVDPGTAVFRRGLLVAAKATFKTKDLKDQLREHAYWRSVRQIHTDAAHLRCGSLPNVRRIGLRLVESPLENPGSPRGFLHQHAPPAGWSLLAELARSRTPLPIQAFCLSLPDEVGPRHLELLDDMPGLPDLRELHLVDDSTGWGRQRDRLGPLRQHPRVKSVDRLVLDGSHVHAFQGTVAEWWTALRQPGQELIVVDAQFAFTVRADAAGVHAIASARPTPGIAHWLGQRLGPASAFASLEVDGPSWHGSDLDAIQKRYGSLGNLVLPKRKRGT